MLDIRVIDNGRGLPVENRDRLFEPYVTTRTKGTGLGLAIVKKIIEEHGGTIALTDAATVDPTSESGSLARIRLPSAPVAAVPADMAAETGRASCTERVCQYVWISVFGVP